MCNTRGKAMWCSFQPPILLCICIYLSLCLRNVVTIRTAGFRRYYVVSVKHTISILNFFVLLSGNSNTYAFHCKYLLCRRDKFLHPFFVNSGRQLLYVLVFKNGSQCSTLEYQHLSTVLQLHHQFHGILTC